MSAQLPYWMSYLPLANFVLTWGIAAYVYWDRRRSDAKKRLAVIESKLQKLETTVKNPPSDDRWEKVEKRLVTIEAAVRTRPQCSSHSRMEENDIKLFKRFDELHGDIRELTGGVKALTRAVDMINEYLLKERK